MLQGHVMEADSLAQLWALCQWMKLMKSYPHLVMFMAWILTHSLTQILTHSLTHFVLHTFLPNGIGLV